jgi:beta-phosphoglucomutase-like phosphatase (HAD superfamily)
MLAGLGIVDRFRAGDQLAYGNRIPLPYLEGLRAVGAIPERSLPFEDSRSGIESAVAAGITTTGIRTRLNHPDMIAAGAVMTSDHFDHPDLID